MSYRRSLARTALFALAYLVATIAGRLTVMDSLNLSLVWPAAGVAVIWFCVQRRAPAFGADVLALVVITLAVNMATGATAAAAVVFTAANLAQVAVFLALISRWRPRLWGAGGDDGLRSPRDLWGLLGVSLLATLAGAAVGPTGMWLLTGHYSWPGTAVWLARNTASILLIGAVGLAVGHAAVTSRARHDSLAAWVRHLAARVAGASRWRIAEYAGVAVCSVGAYLVGFGNGRDLPLAFLLIAVTVWAGARLATPFVVVHDLLVGAVAMLYTLTGQGQFAAIQDPAQRAVISQLFIALVAVVGLALALGRDERRALLTALAAEKAELAAQREEAARRAALLQAIIDATADGLAVIDESGHVTLRNPAAARLLGGQTSPGDAIAGAAHYGLFRLDGTPLPDAEMAHVRALAGEAITDLDVLVRNPGVPEGRIVRTRATPLDGAGRGARQAVVLFHDVTAERLHRDELAAFAGVVAHDLLNPVTAVEGWSEFSGEALDTLPDSPAADQVRDGLTRMSRAAGRMRALIDGLLDYTTARDAAVDAGPIDLNALVTDVTMARLDAAVAAGGPAPRFTAGDLPPVHADPVLLRQLLDNLIGNAIKYTAPGVTPELSITAVRDGDLVRFRVADNGIGIPAGQHEAIFGTFHRAHRSGGFTGTGLGLGICKRIVERHGGTIAAGDNPGGGSYFTFTIPAATGHRAEPMAGSAQLR